MAYRIIREHQYPEHDTYSGKADRCVFDFEVGPDPIVNPDKVADKLVADAEAEVAKQGGTMLKLEVWADTAPLFETKYRCIAYAYGIEAMTPALHWAIWVAIIGAAMLLMAIILYLIGWIVRSVTEIDWGGLIGALRWWAIGAVGFAAAVGFYVLRPKRSKAGG